MVKNVAHKVSMGSFPEALSGVSLIGCIVLGNAWWGACHGTDSNNAR